MLEVSSRHLLVDVWSGARTHRLATRSIEKVNSSGTFVAFPSSSTTHSDSPLAISIVNPKYDFNVYNINY